MTTTSVSKTSAADLPEALATAQAAMHFPEVQEMLRRLSEYELGIFMPHMHDAQTGDFQALPDGVVQVESGLEVSFRSSLEIATQAGCFLPVGWVWRDGAPTRSQSAKWMSKTSQAALAATSNTRWSEETSRAAAGRSGTDIPSRQRQWT